MPPFYNDLYSIRALAIEQKRVFFALSLVQIHLFSYFLALKGIYAARSNSFPLTLQYRVNFMRY
jgi:hypothetical protein